MFKVNVRNNIVDNVEVIQSEFTLDKFGPDFVDITHWYGVEKFESYEQHLMQYPLGVSSDNFDVAIQPIIWANNKGNVGLSYFVNSNCKEVETTFVNERVQFKGRLLEEETEFTEHGFDEADGSLFLPVESMVGQIFGNYMIIGGFEELEKRGLEEIGQLLKLNPNAADEIIKECVYSEFRRRNLIPFSQLKESDLRTNTIYKVHYLNLINGSGITIIKDAVEKFVNGTGPEIDIQKFISGYRWGLEKVNLSSIPADGKWVYLVTCIIHFNENQSTLGLVKVPGMDDTDEDIMIYQDPGWISVMHDNEAVREMGFIKNEDEFWVELPDGFEL